MHVEASPSTVLRADVHWMPLAHPAMSALWAAAAAAGRQLLLAALSPSLLERGPTGRSGRGGGATAGLAEYPLPASADAWSECFRDLTRTLQGGGTFIVGRQRLYPVRAAADRPGDVSPGACRAAFEALCRAVQDELVAQGVGLSAAGDMRRACVSAEQVDGRALRRLAHAVAVHICIGPGMQAAATSRLPPVLWQPLFAVCVGGGQVRVLTFAFVGEPVLGDRPDRKRTPLVLRLATGDLAAAARLATAGELGSPTTTVHLVVEPAAEEAQFILDHIVSLEDELFAAVGTGRWSAFLGGGAEYPQAPHQPSPAGWRAPRAGFPGRPRHVEFPGGIPGLGGL
uniref:Uncharacterized protein n=1 Tax=Alexandrium monilatum TaxID=311494 RepID=A0A7S4S8A2_9DINO